MTEKDYKKHIDTLSDNILAYIYKNIQDIETAKDIVQDTFISLWQHRTKVENNKVKNWLFVTAHNYMLKTIRYNKVRQDSTNIRTLMMNTAQTNKNNWENKQQLEFLLSNLSETMRQCLILKDWEGFSIKEIAKIMQISEENVKINIFRAKVKLKTMRS